MSIFMLLIAIIVQSMSFKSSLKFSFILDALQKAIINFDHKKLRELLAQTVSSFEPQHDISDILHKDEL